MQVDPIKPRLKLPGTKRLKLKCDEPFSRFAFKFKLRRYNSATTELFYFCHIHKFMVGRCSLKIYPISMWEMTVSILSSPILSAHIPYRYPG